MRWRQFLLLRSCSLHRLLAAITSFRFGTTVGIVAVTAIGMAIVRVVQAGMVTAQVVRAGMAIIAHVQVIGTVIAAITIIVMVTVATMMAGGIRWQPSVLVRLSAVRLHSQRLSRFIVIATTTFSGAIIDTGLTALRTIRSSLTTARVSSAIRLTVDKLSLDKTAASKGRLFLFGGN